MVQSRPSTPVALAHRWQIQAVNDLDEAGAERSDEGAPASRSRPRAGRHFHGHSSSALAHSPALITLHFSAPTCIAQNAWTGVRAHVSPRPGWYTLLGSPSCGGRTRSRKALPSGTTSMPDRIFVRQPARAGAVQIKGIQNRHNTLSLARHHRGDPRLPTVAVQADGTNDQPFGLVKRVPPQRANQ
jgi:hypothetical protein